MVGIIIFFFSNRKVLFNTNCYFNCFCTNVYVRRSNCLYITSKQCSRNFWARRRTSHIYQIWMLVVSRSVRMYARNFESSIVIYLRKILKECQKGKKSHKNCNSICKNNHIMRIKRYLSICKQLRFFLLETVQMDSRRIERFKCHPLETLISVLQGCNNNNSSSSLLCFEPLWDGSTNT